MNLEKKSQLYILIADRRDLPEEISPERAFSEHASSEVAVSSVRPESALARKLVARALHAFLGRAPSPEELAGETRAEGGKPYFPAFPDFHYNISHSGSYVVCGYGAQPVGIDIEKIPDKAERAAAIARHFYSEQEKNALNGLTDLPMRRLFTRFWTSRESYIKLTGRGLSEPFKSFYPDLTAGRIYSKNERGREIFITECEAPEGYCMSICTYMPVEHVVRHCFPDR